MAGKAAFVYVGDLQKCTYIHTYIHECMHVGKQRFISQQHSLQNSFIAIRTLSVFGGYSGLFTYS